MAREQMILRGLGLQILKPLVYRLVEPSPLGGAQREFPAQEAEIIESLSTGADDEQVTSYLGTPVFSDLTIKEDEQDEGLNIQTVLFDVQQRKNIVTTTLQGRNGTVKEYISDGDFEVTINGILVEPFSTAYPAGQLKQLMRYMRQGKELIAVSPFLQLFNIYNLVVLSYQMPQQIGFQNQQVFSINCISDEPIELIEDA